MISYDFNKIGVDTTVNPPRPKGRSFLTSNF